jgi:soluble lytic murein transglycosylase-like protein
MNDLLKKYDNDLVYALAGYNWGQGNVDKWIKKGAKFGDLPAETQDYIRSISSRIG